MAKTFDKEVKKRGAKLLRGIFAKQQNGGTKKLADRQRRRRQSLLQLRHQLPLIVETWNHLGEREPVVAFHGEKQEKTVVLDHLVGVIQRLADFAGPATNRLRTHAEQVEAAEEGGGGDDRVFVDDGLLDVTLGLGEERGLMMRRRMA